MADDDYRDNDTLETATDLGLLSMYERGGSLNFIRFDDLNGSNDPIDYFRFTHTKGLDKITITLTIPQVTSGDVLEVIQFIPISGFKDAKPKILYLDNGALELPGEPGPHEFEQSTKTFTFSLTNSSSAVFSLDGGRYNGTSFTPVDLDYDLFVNIKLEYDLHNIIKGTNKRDNLKGTAGDDKIVARGGNDKVNGKAGDDVLIGGPGRDTLTGGGGATDADTFVFKGNWGSDVITDWNDGTDLLDFRGIDHINSIGDLTISPLILLINDQLVFSTKIVDNSHPENVIVLHNVVSPMIESSDFLFT